MLEFPFSQIIPPSPSPSESKSLVYTSVSFFLSCIQGRHNWFLQFGMLSSTGNIFNAWITPNLTIRSPFMLACVYVDISAGVSGHFLIFWHGDKMFQNIFKFSMLLTQKESSPKFPRFYLKPRSGHTQEYPRGTLGCAQILVSNKTLETLEMTLSGSKA